MKNFRKTIKRQQTKLHADLPRAQGFLCSLDGRETVKGRVRVETDTNVKSAKYSRLKTVKLDELLQRRRCSKK